MKLHTTILAASLALTSPLLNAGGALSMKGDWLMGTQSNIGLHGQMHVYAEREVEDTTIFDAEVFWCEPNNVVARLSRGVVTGTGQILMTDFSQGDPVAPFFQYTGSAQSIDSLQGTAAAIDEIHFGLTGNFTMDRIEEGQEVNWQSLGYDCPL